MAMDLREYVRLRCSQMLQLERELSRFHDQLIQQAGHARISELLRHQVDRNVRQIGYLEEVVEHLGGLIGPAGSPLAHGFTETHRQVEAFRPPQQITDLQIIDTVEAMAVLKVGLYRGLIDLAHLLGDRLVIERLERNQSDEENLRAVLHDHMRSLATALVGEMRKAA